MKKLIGLLLTLSFAVLIGVGASVMIAQDAQAAICIAPYLLIQTCNTGPLCTDPAYPYYIDKWGTNARTGKPCYLFGGCHDGVHAGC